MEAGKESKDYRCVAAMNRKPGIEPEHQKTIIEALKALEGVKKKLHDLLKK